MTTLEHILNLENMDFHNKFENIDLSELMSKFENMVIDEETISISKLLMKGIEVDTVKKMIGNTKNDAKSIQSGKSKEYFITENINNGTSLFKFMVLQKQFTKYMNKKESKIAWDFLSNREESEKYGFYDENDFKNGGKYFRTKIPKQTEQQIQEWTEKAFPKINGNVYENQFDLSVLITSLKEND